MGETPDSDWVARFADEVIAAADRYRPGKPIVCASGLSPSGPIHLGNLREVLTPHLVADEICRSGVPCEHIMSSKGGVPTPSQALSIMEAPLLRWLYSRKKPAQSITVSFGQELHRMYNGLDALGSRVSAGTAGPTEVAAYGRATRAVAAGRLPETPVRLPFGTLASVYDVTTGQPRQLLRVLRDVAPGQDIDSLDALRPRLDRAARWITTELPAESRILVRPVPDGAAMAALDDDQRASVQLLLDGLDAAWSLDGLTTLVYGVPKKLLGLPMDVKPTPELRAAQRSFFALLYELLVGRDTGLRLPTLLLAIGADKVRDLLTVPESDEDSRNLPNARRLTIPAGPVGGVI